MTRLKKYTVYHPEKKALCFFGEPSLPEFWDRHWTSLPLSQTTGTRLDTFFTSVVKEYLKPEDGIILEGGCGIGQHVCALKKNGYQAVGLDFAKHTVSRVNAELPELYIRWGDVRSLPFDDNYFAGYLSLGVIEHFWHGYDSILSEMRRVIRSEGYLFLTIPYMSPLRRLKAMAGMYSETLPQKPEESFYQFAYDVKNVARDFSEKGFSLVNSFPMDGIKGFKDEVRLGRKWLQGIYSGKRRFHYKGRLDQLLTIIAGHIMVFVFKKETNTRWIRDILNHLMWFFQKSPRIVLFFTAGVSLQTWESVGIFDRETALYRSLVSKGFEVVFVTYGHAKDRSFREKLPGIRILCNRWRLPRKVYTYWIPVLFARYFASPCVIKTNQMRGAQAAMRAAKIWNRPLIARCGYMWSDLAAHGGPERVRETKRAFDIERTVFTAANGIVVTTASMKTYVQHHFQIQPDRIQVIPNYVLTDWFVPDASVPNDNRICFVGRLSPEKDPLMLVEACRGLNIELVMVGDGPLLQAIVRRADQLGVRVNMMGQVSHRKLPEVLQQSTLFALVSAHEGHPKALLEAMSCGLPVIGADVHGIRDILEHRKNGYLCARNPKAIRHAIQEVLENRHMSSVIGRNARGYVVERFSLKSISALEAELHQRFFKDRRRHPSEGS